MLKSPGLAPLLGSLLLPFAVRADDASNASSRYRSPYDVVAVSDSVVAVSDRTAAALVLVDLQAATILREVALRGEPTAVLASADGRRVYVSENGAATVAEVDVAGGGVLRRFVVGLRPLGLASASPNRLLVANSVSHDVCIVDLASGDTVERLELPREPFFAASAPDGEHILVGNLLPVGSPGTDTLSTYVSLLRVPRDRVAKVVANLQLPAASTSVRELQISADGRWAYVVHTVGRINSPATQLERGWISTNHLSILDLEKRELYASVILDAIDAGAADPWGLVLAADGAVLWITLRGTHELVRLDLRALHRFLAEGAEGPAGLATSYTEGTASVWERIREDPSRRPELADDLTALSAAGVSRRIALPGKGPRGIDITPDGKRLVVACYYSGDVVVVDTGSGEVVRSIKVGPEPPADLARQGERLFHDATISFQNWLSCSTCHPDRARNDALHWDLPNDGLGTPQMTRSLVKSYLVAPTTARGVRPTFEASVTAGFRFLHTNPSPRRIELIASYLSSLEIERSPFVDAGGLSAAQQRGRDLFEGKAGCTRCHRGEIRTDLERHDVGTASEDEVGGSEFYTPKLFELYRTAPFLHDGRAATLHEIFERWNPAARHGKADGLSSEELDDLVKYLLTL